MILGQKQAFVIAGTGSGCGKTTVTLGIMCALIKRNLHIQPFKIGPDYLDSGWHSAVTGVASRNLDAFMLPEKTLNTLFYRCLHDKDVAVIEGVMGLYDGYGTDPNYCSSAAMAKQLGCPVILLVDGKAVSTSIAATVMGFQRFDPSLNIAGVIVNRVNSDSHFQLLKHAIEHYCHIPVLGRLPVMKEMELPSRHLGLVAAETNANQDPRWDKLALQIEETIDLDKLLALATYDNNAFLDSLECHHHASLTPAKLAGTGLTLALAYDEVFNFYYPDNLELLEQAGVRIVRFSPLHDSELPDCQMVYLGGGYPEIHAKNLSANHRMRQAINEAHQRGVAIYAECGGLMYLGDAITDVNNDKYPMVGIIPGESTMNKGLTRFGYCEATANQDTTLIAKGETVRGHEFHYSDFTSHHPTAFDFCKKRDGIIQKQWAGGYQVGHTFASYLHIHFAQQPNLLARWIRIARGILP